MAKEKTTVTNANVDSLNSPMAIDAFLVRVYSMISKNNIDAVNETRQKNGLEPLKPNTKADSPGSRPDKAHHFYMDLDFSRKNVNGRMLKDLCTNPIDPAILADWAKGVAYDNSFKSAVQKSLESADLTQEQINEIAQKELEREKVRESSGQTATFSEELIAIVEKLNPALLRSIQSKNDAGELVDTDKKTIDGKKVKLSDITKLALYPNMQKAQTALICFAGDTDKYRKWKSKQGTEFSKAIDMEKEEKAKQEADL